METQSNEQPVQNRSEAPLKRIPFTPEDEGILMNLRFWMNIVAIIIFVFSAVIVISGIGSLLINPIGGILILGVGALMIIIGISLINAGKSFQIVVDSDDNDQINLMNALRELKKTFTIVGVILIVYVAITIIAVIIMLAAGASIFGGAMPSGSGMGGF